MGVVAGVAAVASLAGTGLSIASTLTKAKGENSADIYKAQSLEHAADVGQVKAVQTSAEDTRRIVDTLGNIDAIRAAAHDDPTSPTGIAVRDYQEALGGMHKAIDVNNILEQSAQDTRDAAYLRTAGKYALQGGELAAAGTLFQGVGKTDFSKFGAGKADTGSPLDKMSLPTDI